jgi:phospholipid transport system transporter-binding protein
VSDWPARVDIAGDGWRVAGALTMDTAATLLAESRDIALPPSGVVDLRDVEVVDSAGVAVLLAWKRRAFSEGIRLMFEGLPPTLTSLAELYGVEDLLQEPVT